MKNKKQLLLYTSYIIPLIAVLWIASSTTSCGVYRFKDVSIPDSIKTVKINYIENRARYINPQLSPQLSDKLRQKIVNQTRLTQTNGDADWEISGYVSDYSVTTAAISGQQNATDRLNVSVHITLYDKLANKTSEYDVTRSFDYAASQTLEQAQTAKNEEIISNVTDEIFNKLFSNW
ncbi:MAG: LptE family protein [Bacteroidetes bacterium]|nr:LptE family protein [Bacteroidota bacterium]